MFLETLQEPSAWYFSCWALGSTGLMPFLLRGSEGPHFGLGHDGNFQKGKEKLEKMGMN